MKLQLTPETQANLDMLKEFYKVPENCSDPQAFLRKRRALAKQLYVATQGYDSMNQPVTFAVVHGLIPEMQALMLMIPERTTDDYKKLSKIDYTRLLPPETYPNFNKPSRLELIE